MDMLPPEQMAFLIPNLLGMLEALFIVWVIFTVEKWRGKKEVRKLAAEFIAPKAWDEEHAEGIQNLDDEGMALFDAAIKDSEEAHNQYMQALNLRLAAMKEIISSHQKPSPVEE